MKAEEPALNEVEGMKKTRLVGEDRSGLFLGSDSCPMWIATTRDASLHSRRASSAKWNARSQSRLVQSLLTCQPTQPPAPSLRGKGSNFPPFLVGKGTGG